VIVVLKTVRKFMQIGTNCRGVKSFQSGLALASAALATLGGNLVFAGTIWDAGGGADTNINTPANWDANTTPDLTGPSSVTFGISASTNTATVNADVKFTKITFNTSSVFTLASGAGGLTLRATNSGANTSAVLVSNSGAANNTIATPLLVEAVATASPFGSLLTINNNRNFADTTALKINNGISLAASSTATSYDIRYANGSSGLGDTRIAGTISGLGTLANAGTAWAGDLIIADSQASVSNSNINIQSNMGFGNPTAAARLVLGETSTDVQTWNNVTLNNTFNLAIGGTITANAIAGSGTAKITGTGAAGATLKLTSGTIASTMGVGGAGANENLLSLVKQNAGTLTIDGAKTYTGTTTVTGGTLNLTGSLASNMTVNAGATLSGEGSTTGSLTFGAGSSNLTFDPTTVTGAFTAGSVVTNGSVLLTPSGATTIGTTYTVLKQTTGTFAGSPTANFIAASRGTLAYANSNKDLTLTPTAAAALKWDGVAVNPTFWDVASTVNWKNAGSPDRFYANDTITFDDTASSFTVVAQGASVSPGSVTFNNTTNAYTVSGAGIAGSGTITKGGTNLVTVGNVLTNSGGVIVNQGTLTLTAANNFGAGGVTVNGGTLNLTNTNAFTGVLTVNGGTLNAATGAALGTLALSRPIALNGGSLSHDGATFASDQLAFTVGGNAALAVTGVTNGNPNTLRAGGPLTGSGNIDINVGTVAFGRNGVATLGNTYSGTITVKSGGRLDIRNPDSAGATGASAKTIIESGGILLINPFNQPNGVVFNAETMDFQGTSSVVNQNQATTPVTNTLTGPITTAGTLTVSSVLAPLNPGAATLVFTGAIGGFGGVMFGAIGGQVGTYVLTDTTNGYAGATVVNAASTLKLTGSASIASTVSISLADATAVLDVTGLTGNYTLGASQTLGGIGKVVATGKSFTASGTVSPGNSPGTLRIDGGTLVLDANSDFVFELGTSSDLISLINGASLSLGAGSLGISDFAFVDSGGFGVGTYTLIGGAGSLVGTLDGSDLSSAVLGYTGTLTTSGNNVVLNVTAIPEPTALAALAIGFAGALVRRRRA